jgi:hypothetical protein
MGYKKIDQSLDFADFALASSLKHNRSLKLRDSIGNRVYTFLYKHGISCPVLLISSISIPPFT